MVVSYAIIGREHRDAFLLAVGETEAMRGEVVPPEPCDTFSTLSVPEVGQGDLMRLSSKGDTF